MSIRWGQPSRQPVRLTDRAWCLIACAVAAPVVLYGPRLVLSLAVYVMEAF